MESHYGETHEVSQQSNMLNPKCNVSIISVMWFRFYLFNNAVMCCVSYFINITNCTINLTFWMRNIVRGCCTWKRRGSVKIKFTADMWLQILSTVVCVHWLQLQLGGVKAGPGPDTSDSRHWRWYL